MIGWQGTPSWKGLCGVSTFQGRLTGVKTSAKTNREGESGGKELVGTRGHSHLRSSKNIVVASHKTKMDYRTIDVTVQAPKIKILKIPY